MQGLIHIYCGDGKGKTTAAAGLALRMAGAGRKVVFAQFFKNGSSSELRCLEQLDKVDILVCTESFGFFRNMEDETRKRAQQAYTSLFEQAVEQSREDTGLLVLDEILSAVNYGMVPQQLLLDFLKEKPEELEVVLTGRDPSGKLLELADYVTRMEKIKHPFDRGITARFGVEY